MPYEIENSKKLSKWKKLIEKKSTSYSMTGKSFNIYFALLRNN